MLRNTDVRTKAKERDVKLYEVAAYMGKSQAYLTRKLYFELDGADKQELFAIIDEIAAKKENAAHSATNTMNG